MLIKSVVILGSLPATPPENSEEPICTTPTRTKQESSLRLTCVASGYSKYSPHNERKNYNDRGDGQHSPTSSTEPTCSTQKLNGATPSLDNNLANGSSLVNGVTTNSVSVDTNIANGHVDSASTELINAEETTLQTDNVNGGTTLELNGNIEKTTLHLDSNTINEDSDKLVVCTEDVAVTVLGNGETNPTANGCKDEVDRSALSLTLVDESLPARTVIESKLINDIDPSNSVQDSPSKKVEKLSIFECFAVSL